MEASKKLKALIDKVMSSTVSEVGLHEMLQIVDEVKQLEAELLEYKADLKATDEQVALLKTENAEIKHGMEQNLRAAQHAEADNKQLRDTVRKADMLFMSLGQVGHILEEVLSIMEEGRLICIAAIGDNDGG